MGEITVTCREQAGNVETTVEHSLGDAPEETPWPPGTLFTLPQDNPRIRKIGISDLALSRSIFNLHNGDLEKRESSGKVTYVLRLPA